VPPTANEQYISKQRISQFPKPEFFSFREMKNDLQGHGWHPIGPKPGLGIVPNLLALNLIRINKPMPVPDSVIRGNF